MAEINSKQPEGTLGNLHRALPLKGLQKIITYAYLSSQEWKFGTFYGITTGTVLITVYTLTVYTSDNKC